MDTKENIVATIEKEHENSGIIGTPQEEIQAKADDTHNQLLAILHEELQKPEYKDLSPEEIATLLDSPVEEIKGETIILPAPKDRISAAAKDEWDLYIRFNGNFLASFNAKIDAEIKEDPDGVGYAGLTREDAITLMENPVEKTIKKTFILGSRISQLFMGIAYAPNTVTADDVKEALQYGNN